jgi:hypothetical protein
MAQPLKLGHGALPRRVRLSEVLTGDEFVVLTVSADPEPMNALFGGKSDRAVVETDSNTEHPSAPKGLEVQRWVSRIFLQESVVLSGECLDLWRQPIKAGPEPL